MEEKSRKNAMMFCPNVAEVIGDDLELFKSVVVPLYCRHYGYDCEMPKGIAGRLAKMAIDWQAVNDEKWERTVERNQQNGKRHKPVSRKPIQNATEEELYQIADKFKVPRLYVAEFMDDLANNSYHANIKGVDTPVTLANVGLVIRSFYDARPQP